MTSVLLGTTGNPKGTEVPLTRATYIHDELTHGGH